MAVDLPELSDLLAIYFFQYRSQPRVRQDREKVIENKHDEQVDRFGSNSMTRIIEDRYSRNGSVIII
jgi:hypothetical protein